LHVDIRPVQNSKPLRLTRIRMVQVFAEVATFAVARCRCQCSFYRAILNSKTTHAACLLFSRCLHVPGKLVGRSVFFDEPSAEGRPVVKIETGCISSPFSLGCVAVGAACLRHVFCWYLLPIMSPAKDRTKASSAAWSRLVSLESSEKFSVNSSIRSVISASRCCCCCCCSCRVFSVSTPRMLSELARGS